MIGSLESTDKLQNTVYVNVPCSYNETIGKDKHNFILNFLKNQHINGNQVEYYTKFDNEHKYINNNFT